MLRLQASIAILAIYACSADVNQSAPEKRFGFLTASLGTESFAGTLGPDSTVAEYNPEVGQLTIGGRRGGRDWTEAVELTMVCQSAPDTGAYRVSTSFYTPVSAGVYRLRIRRWLPRRWRTTNHAFTSDSTVPGILRLDTLDLKSGAISGSFRVRVRTIDQTPVDGIYATGFFSGRVRTSMLHQTRPVKFAPDMGRDCTGAKRP
jgi:hypothetical protein